jgi:hypothetical protein
LISRLRFSDFEEQQHATLWDAATGKNLLHLPETDCLAFAPDNRSVAVVCGFAFSKIRAAPIDDSPQTAKLNLSFSEAHT